MSNSPPSSPLPPLGYDGEIPSNAINLFPRSIGPKIFHIPDRDLILKVGKGVKMREANAMRFVSGQSSIPVPEVFEAYEKDGVGHIFMSKINGRPLGEVWSKLSVSEVAYVADQLRGYVKELWEMRGDFYGSLWNQPCEDIFFSHLCLATPDSKQYGPYKSRQEYNKGLVEALINSRPGGRLGALEEKLIAKISTLTEDAKIFSHGDLHLDNILVNDSGTIVGVVDWGCAGFSIPGREFLEASLRARDPNWIKTIAEVFPEDTKAGYDVFRELDRALILYSGF